MPNRIIDRISPRAGLVLALLLLAGACGSGGGSGNPPEGTSTRTPPPGATPSPGAPVPTPSASPPGRPSPAAGALDETFGDGGVVRGVVPAGLGALRGVAMQPGGRIVALADVGDAAHPQASGFALVGYDTRGRIDDTFGAGGVAEHPLCPSGDGSCAGLAARRILALPDGRLLVLAIDGSGSLQTLLVAVTADGAIDGSVAEDGVLVLPARIEQIALAPDGTVVGVGRGRDAFALLRLDSDLVPDARFGPLGVRLVDLEADADLEVFRHLAVQRDGRIVAGGVLQALDAPAAVLARFTPEGEPDPTFADHGWLIAAPRADLFRGVSPDAGPLAVTDDGRIFVESPLPASGATRTVERLLADGSADATWSAPITAALELLPRADGGLLTVGLRRVIDFGFVADLNGELRRFTADGTSDVAFGDDGTVGLPLLDGTATLPAGAVVQGDGKLVVGCNRVGGSGWLLARFLP